MFNLDTLCKELIPVTHKWFELGEQLGIAKDYLMDIDTPFNYDERCMEMMLRKGLKSANCDITWKKIVNALRSPGVRESRLANQLEAKYRQSLSELIYKLHVSEYNVMRYCS